MATVQHKMIKRKAVPRPAPAADLDHKVPMEDVKSETIETVQGAAVVDHGLKKEDGLPVAEGPLEEGEICPDLDEQMANLELETNDEHRPPEYEDGVSTPQAIESAMEQVPEQKHSKFKTVLGEVKHFAGDLIAHPYEATKQYSILRHSHGLVYYLGPTTSVAITVFSTQPLPADRKLFLQKRGFSGKAGLKLSATLGSRSAWIDVTPSIEATADLLPKADERAWQRDITKFLKKAKDAKSKSLCLHRPIETDIVRIPHVAEDGYFRIVLCAGRKVLCPSPMFRYVSASLDPGKLRGASLTTLPLELGIKIGAVVARNAANTAAHGALQPVTTTYQNTLQPVVQKYNPMGLTQVAAQTIYDDSMASVKVNNTIDTVRETYGDERNLAFQQVGTDTVAGAATEPVEAIEDEGPRQPFPIRFPGLVTQGLSEKTRHMPGMAAVNLRNVPEDVLLRLSTGVYIGWGSLSKTKVSKTSTLPDQAYDTWMKVVMEAKSLKDKQARVVEAKRISVLLLHDFEGANIFDSRLNVMLLTCLTPISGSVQDIKHDPDRTSRDIAKAQAVLNRPAWQVESVLEQEKVLTKQRSLTDRAADAWQAGQKQIDRVPLHRLGVRTNSMGLRDQLIGNGGICVKR
jgi:hypothetical protein